MQLSAKSAVSNCGGDWWVRFAPPCSAVASTAPSLVGGDVALMRSFSSSCWVDPGMESPSSGSEFWSPAITKRAPFASPPVPPSSS